MDFQGKMREVHGYIREFSEENPKLGTMLDRNLDDAERDKDAFLGQNISEFITNMKWEAFARKWFVDEDSVTYAVQNNVHGQLPNASVSRDFHRDSEYRESVPDPIRKPNAGSQMIQELEKAIEEEILPL
ncbi:MAG: hypothetical protein IJ083_01595 [Clostridia bacterium]|nr:hypothetical protein [Clostridia bacterium]